MTTVDEAVVQLNTMLEADPRAMQALIQLRIPCNQALADHPTAQVGNDPEGYTVGPLGIINGLFGVDKDQWGHIAAVYEDGILRRFEKLGEPAT